MDIGKHIQKVLDEQGRSQIWLADKLGIHDKTFSGKLKRNSITGEELLRVAKLLNIDLEELKEEVQMEEKVYNLVKEQFEGMKFSKTFSNQATLTNKCTDIIYKEWGVSNDTLWKLVDKYVKEFIPDEMD